MYVIYAERLIESEPNRTYELLFVAKSKSLPDQIRTRAAGGGGGTAFVVSI